MNLLRFGPLLVVMVQKVLARPVICPRSPTPELRFPAVMMTVSPIFQLLTAEIGGSTEKRGIDCGEGDVATASIIGELVVLSLTVDPVSGDLEMVS